MAAPDFQSQKTQHAENVRTESSHDEPGAPPGAKRVTQDPSKSITVGCVLEGRYQYEIEGQLGKGGFGAVYLAKTLGRNPADPDCPPEKVAVKVFQAPAGKDPLKLLKRELSAMLAMRHDRIPRVYDWSLEGGSVAMVVIQYFPYGSLLDASPYGAALNESAAWRLLTDLLQALKVAHNASILHLDIKPANVLLDGNGGFVLTDFGISQGALVSRSIVAPSLGSPGYQAPEQATRQFDKVDARTDLWGIGITVWSMFTGIPLWLRPELHNTDERRGYYGLPMLKQHRKDCSDSLQEIVMGLLTVDPSKRPGGAAEVLSRIQQLVTGSGMDADTFAATRAAKIDKAELAHVVDGLMDPLWASIGRQEGFDRFFVRFSDTEAISKEGDNSHFTYVLLSGKVAIEKAGKEIFVEDREGTFLGEVATLTGEARTATMRAKGVVWTAVFNAAELEKFVTLNPAVGIRLIKSLASRLQRESRLREAAMTKG